MVGTKPTLSARNSFSIRHRRTSSTVWRTSNGALGGGGGDGALADKKLGEECVGRRMEGMIGCHRVRTATRGRVGLLDHCFHMLPSVSSPRR